MTVVRGETIRLLLRRNLINLYTNTFTSVVVVVVVVVVAMADVGTLGTRGVFLA